MNRVRIVPLAPLPPQRNRSQPQRMPYPDYPVARRIRSNAHDFQLAFSEEAATRLHDRFDDALLEASRTGLLVLARNEQALKPPTDAIRALYPWQLEVGAAQVRYLEGETAGEVTHEPVMRVTVSAPRRHGQAIREDIAARTDRQVSLDYAYDRILVTANVRLARLLGYAEFLDSFAGGDYELRIGLSEYAPIEPPDPAAA